jgi:hypothetical protein
MRGGRHTGTRSGDASTSDRDAWANNGGPLPGNRHRWLSNRDPSRSNRDLWLIKCDRWPSNRDLRLINRVRSPNDRDRSLVRSRFHAQQSRWIAPQTGLLFEQTRLIRDQTRSIARSNAIDRRPIGITGRVIAMGAPSNRDFSAWGPVCSHRERGYWPCTSHFRAGNSICMPCNPGCTTWSPKNSL